MKKSLALKAREEANAEPIKNQNVEDSNAVWISEIPPPPPLTERIVESISSDEVLDSTEELVSPKRPRGSSCDRFEVYVPSWNICTSDSIIFKAPEAARQLGGHLCR